MSKGKLLDEVKASNYALEVAQQTIKTLKDAKKATEKKTATIPATPAATATPVAIPVANSAVSPTTPVATPVANSAVSPTTPPGAATPAVTPNLRGSSGGNDICQACVKAVVDPKLGNCDFFRPGFEVRKGRSERVCCTACTSCVVCVKCDVLCNLCGSVLRPSTTFYILLRPFYSMS